MFYQLSNAVDNFFSLQNQIAACATPVRRKRPAARKQYYPCANLFRDGDGAVLTAEIPGMAKEDIKMEVKERTVRIAGKRKVEYPKDAQLHRLERGDMDFDRSFKLDYLVDTDKIEAEYKDGILRVALPRADRDKPKKIEIN